MIELFDAQAGFGGAKPGQCWIPSAGELVGHMKRLSIGKALVRTDFEEMDPNVPYSNRLLYEACAANKGLVPCPTVLPATGGDVPSEKEQIEEAIKHRSGGVTIRPSRDGWSLAEWCSGKLMSKLEERRLPVLCRGESFTVEALADTAKQYPKMPIMFYQVGYRFQRTLIPLMKKFKNVHLALGCPYSVHRGVETLVEELGPERLLFGTGFPASDMMPGITMITYAEISVADKRMIGKGNLERLIRGIKK